MESQQHGASAARQYAQPGRLQPPRTLDLQARQSPEQHQQKQQQQQQQQQSPQQQQLCVWEPSPCVLDALRTVDSLQRVPLFGDLAEMSTARDATLVSSTA